MVFCEKFSHVVEGREGGGRCEAVIFGCVKVNIFFGFKLKTVVF